MMRILIVLCAALVWTGPASAQGKQQERMKSCNAQASQKDLKGGERQAFMSECLKGEKLTAQQGRMKSCNAEASKKEMKGDARKAFMKKCLSARAHEGAAAGGR